MTLDEQQLRILELIASGHSYDQIVAALGDGNYHDIFGAAQAARDTFEHRGPAYRVEDVRRQYPNAYRPWDPASDQQLLDAFFGGASDEDLSGQFGRSIGSIQSRLLKTLRGKLEGSASVETEPPPQTPVQHSASAAPSVVDDDAPAIIEVLLAEGLFATAARRIDRRIERREEQRTWEERKKWRDD